MKDPDSPLALLYVTPEKIDKSKLFKKALQEVRRRKLRLWWVGGAAGHRGERGWGVGAGNTSIIFANSPLLSTR